MTTPVGEPRSPAPPLALGGAICSHGWLETLILAPSDVSPPVLNIEKARRRHARAALAIRNAAILKQCVNHYSSDALEGWTGGKLTDAFMDVVEKHYYVAIDDRQVVGTAMINIQAGKIDGIFVHPDHMRKGIGKKLIQFLEGIALSHGLKALDLQSTLNAVPFYHSCGFEGEAVATYTTSRGITLECIPMKKVIAS